MAPLCADERRSLYCLIAEHGLQKLQEYIDQTFKPTIISLRKITPSNAHTWIELDAYVDWLVKDCQTSARDAAAPPSPSETPTPDSADARAALTRQFYGPLRIRIPSLAPAVSSSPRYVHPHRRTDDFNITIKTLTGKQVSVFSLIPSMTVKQLKERVAGLDGLPCADEMRFIFAGKQLEDERSLVDYNIQRDAVVHMTERRRGGKPVIYLFAPHAVQASVRLHLIEEWSFSAVYPVVPTPEKGQGQSLEWQVETRADGSLRELKTGLDVAYMFWEAHTNVPMNLSPPASPILGHTADVFRPSIAGVSNDDSVLLPVSDITPYLDKSLAALGLHVEARTSFITYWLPDMLKHSHVALRFLDQVAYAHAAPLDVAPKPDVVTRIFMLFRGVKEAKLGEWEGAQAKAAEPTGMWREVVGVNLRDTLDESLFRVIEWGGMEVFH
ncbi:hypothetical protein EV714DRAFT_268658 [Schizophyllum commune]